MRGITSPEKTADGYELRSRGPTIQGFDALDNMYVTTREKQYPNLLLENAKFVASIARRQHTMDT